MAKIFGNTGGSHAGQSQKSQPQSAGLPEERPRPSPQSAEPAAPSVIPSAADTGDTGDTRRFPPLPGTQTAPPSQTAVADPAKKRRWPRWAAIAAAVLAGLYLFVVFIPFGPVRRLRNAYLETALSTMSHQWLATAFFPASVVEEVRAQMKSAIDDQVDLSSQWGIDDPLHVLPQSPAEPAPEIPQEELRTLPPQLLEDPGLEDFFTDFYQLDREETLFWAADNMDLMEGGWAKLFIDKAGTDEDGLPIHTTRGDQVLAIDAVNRVLLVRVKGPGYRGVLAIAKDPARLSLRPSADIGETGQNAGSIASRYNGLLAMTASGFIDEEGHGSGGILTGFARCDGEDYGTHFRGGYKRIEKREDDRLYITDASADVRAAVTDAMEFTPALIVDGEVVVDDRCGWTAFNPRACLGQSDQYEILMLVIEGRMPTVSLGISVVDCAQILHDYRCMQALNMDGGTSAILWYNGRYVTLCSNTALSAGRRLPNAWVYAKAEE